MTAPAVADQRAAETPESGRPRSGSIAGIWRMWRLPILLAAIVLAGGILIALLQPSPATDTYLDPASTGPLGAHAVTDILAARGHHVTTTHAVGPTVAAASSGATVVVTSSYFLTNAQLSSLATVPGNIVVFDPSPAALAALAPGVAPAGIVPLGAVQPRCALSAATLAGNATMGGDGMKANSSLPRLQVCYPAHGRATLLQFEENSRLVTLVGSGQLLTNQHLGQLGNAALALNLLEASPRVVWLVPELATAAPPGHLRRSLTSMIPLAAWLVVIQLAIAGFLAALWRARRFGPVVAERLPVVVRASETVEGHARLYQSRRAREGAAASLRAAAIGRLTAATGLPPGASPEALADGLSARTGQRSEHITTTLFGPAPAGDVGLVKLADDLDALERQVLTQ